ncbi:small multi-drug export protein [Candidatus Poseidoniales archaeon]|nr:small multi-drug export protein [Candidatus Poseidoniales archaeon]MDB2333899.1 small multi-drug export protein [Candidatus Poseidoniales archaeon]MDB2348431.1 small multi-drug export protein [Candidatus Poseidoniales archaeon]
MGEAIVGEELPKEAPEPESKSDSLLKELNEIRRRRTDGDKRSIFAKKENPVLFVGVMYGVLYGVLILSMSSGMLGQSTAMDHSASNTFLDIGEDPCNEVDDEPWIHIFPNEDAEVFSLNVYNLPAGYVVLTYNIVEEGTSSSSNATESTRALNDENNRAHAKADYSELDEGNYVVSLSVEMYETREDSENDSIQPMMEMLEKSVDFELEITTKGFAFLPFGGDETVREVRITDPGPRSCWSVQELGNWGYILLVAELGGGRETAMLAGGAAGIPAWWMAFNSLSLSIFSLLIAYPIMYKVYHQEADDILSRNHIIRLVDDIISKCERRLGISIDHELVKVEPRDLSIDIMVPYKNTENTLSDSKTIRDEILREVLEEFALFHVFKPVQLTVRSIGSNQAIDFDSGVGIGVGDRDEEESPENYTSFFEELHSLSRIEDEVRDSLDLFFVRDNTLKLENAVITSDDRIVFVSIIFKPTTRFAYFRYKRLASEVEDELRSYISERNKDLLTSQELIVKARNQVSTLADRSGAGRVETKGDKDERIAAVARQDGFGGRMLQTKLLGDILSTVEYTANEKREMINKWGFWGLIVFVWIPFMASGVLVGAMLGLLSRMKFMRVLMATMVGGFIASITWAYTAEGIVRIMHKYKLEAVIPIIIIVFILAAILHIRSTKNRRQTELFEDTLLDNFHNDIKEKYGSN